MQVSSNLALANRAQSPSCISRITDVITKERCYAVAWAISTAAITAFSYYSESAYILGGIALGVANIYFFNKAVREWDPSKHSYIRAWVITACFVTSIVLAIAVSHSLLSFKAGCIALRTLNTGDALLFFWRGAGLIGFGTPLAKELFCRGQELLQTAKWTAMENYMSQRQEVKNKIDDIFGEFGFLLAIMAPNFMETLGAPLLISEVQAAILPLVPQDKIEKKLREVLQSYSVLPEAGFLAQRKMLVAQAMVHLSNLLIEQQKRLLPDILPLRQHYFDLFPESIKGMIAQEQKELAGKYESSFKECCAEYYALENRLDQIGDPKVESDKVEAISKEVFALSQKIGQYISAVGSYGVELNMKHFADLQKKLSNTRESPFGTKLAVLNAQRDNNEIDLADPTWNYFLQSWRHGIEFHGRLLTAFNVSTNDELDTALDKHQIGTIGEFITKVLAGDQSTLQDQDEVINLLNGYLKEPGDLRNRLYTAISGTVINQGSKIVRVAWKTAYFAVMLLGVISPLVTFPVVFAAGFTACLIYKSSSLVQKAVAAVICDYVLDQVRIFALLVMRRPLFSTFLGAPPQEMQTFASSDFFGKMRLLCFESFCGDMLTSATIHELPGVGSFVQGAAVADEATRLAYTGWTNMRKRFAPIPRQAIAA